MEEEVLADEESLNHVIALVKEHGSDCWWELPEEDLLPPSRKGQGWMGALIHLMCGLTVVVPGRGSMRSIQSKMVKQETSQSLPLMYTWRALTSIVDGFNPLF